MQKITQWINGLSLKKKIIYYSYAVLIPLLLIICSLMTIYNFGKAQEEIQDNIFHNLKSLSDNTETVMKDVENLSTYIAINKGINDVLMSKNPRKLNQDHQLWEHEAPIRMVEDMIALKGYIKTVAIYPENGVKPYLRCTDSSSYMTGLGMVRGTETYMAAVQNRGKIGWRYVDKGGEDVYIASRTDKLVLYREIFNPTKKMPLGYLLLGITKDTFDKFYINELDGDKEGIIVYNGYKQQLLEYGKVGSNVKRMLTEEKVLNDTNRFQKAINYKDYTLYLYHGEESNITICKVTEKLKLIQVGSGIFYLPILVLIAVLIGLLPVLWIMSNIVTKPLGKVCMAMSKFKKGDFEQKVEVETNDEIGEVANCFNKMVTDIKQLIDKNYVMALKERESELSLLQAQINPHFLYNTLDSLYWQACNAENDEIAENIYALSQFFRLVLGGGKDEITVKQEIELVSRYLEIQKMRFSRKIEYEISLDSTISGVKIPKLILQPFVENAVIHGIEDSQKECKISVVAKQKDEHIEMTISDSGVGMTKEQIEDIWNGIQSESISRHGVGGYAIRNVKERLELRYQKGFSLSIDSQINVGTTVTIIIPKQG